MRARNTTTGESFEAQSFEEAFAWGVSHLPGPELDPESVSSYKEEYETQGRTCFDDLQGRCYAETIEIWDPAQHGDDNEDPEDW